MLTDTNFKFSFKMSFDTMERDRWLHTESSINFIDLLQSLANWVCLQNLNVLFYNNLIMQ